MSAPTTVAGDPVLWLARPGVKLVLYLRDDSCRTLDKTERPPPCFPQENKEAVRSEAWMWDVEQQMLAMAGT